MVTLYHKNLPTQRLVPKALMGYSKFMNKLCIFLLLFCFDLATHPRIAQVVAPYKRSVTILHIGTAQQMVVPRPGDVHILLSTDGPVQLSGVTVLAPPQLTIADLSKLAQCEHIDIVIVYDSSFIQAPPAQKVGVIMQLGQQVLLFADKTLERVVRKSSMRFISEATEKYPALYEYSSYKTMLTYARFTQRYPSQSSYLIQSTFTDKYLIKGESQTKWIHGINMVTFVMLHGVYPTTKQIKQQLRSLATRYPEHTDLVLGNMILQGTTLIPIDGTDGKRASSPRKCIQAALRAFNRPRSNPSEWLEWYTRAVYKDHK